MLKMRRLTTFVKEKLDSKERNDSESSEDVSNIVDNWIIEFASNLNSECIYGIEDISRETDISGKLKILKSMTNAVVKSLRTKDFQIQKLQNVNETLKLMNQGQHRRDLEQAAVKEIAKTKELQHQIVEKDHEMALLKKLLVDAVAEEQQRTQTLWDTINQQRNAITQLQKDMALMPNQANLQLHTGNTSGSAIANSKNSLTHTGDSSDRVTTIADSAVSDRSNFRNNLISMGYESSNGQCGLFQQPECKEQSQTPVEEPGPQSIKSKGTHSTECGSHSKELYQRMNSKAKSIIAAKQREIEELKLMLREERLPGGMDTLYSSTESTTEYRVGKCSQVEERISFSRSNRSHSVP